MNDQEAVMLSGSHNFDQVSRAFEQQLAAAVKGKAAVSALNKTADQAKTQMARGITSRYALPSAYVKERLRVVGASMQGGQMRLEARLIGGDGKRRSMNLIHFVEKRVTLAQGRKRAKAGTQRSVFIKVIKAGGFKEVKGAFIGNKGRTVFERTGKGRLPIKSMQVIDVPQMFNAKVVNQLVLEFVRTKFPEIFAREMRWRTGGTAGA